ncbi:hypothetical protein N7492_007219 [Penicillium capsulatum]|uniref:Berberine/berberine-like domain-containing protein n=1 Tax=Penicillium capsulatum TaxID=69766 RepID=A0A9W9HZF1_9EURO|nr:hypothetical protein N7492_007219 [Penicillium capsulatum]KAJ6117057.1 hypothetical protein N7512_006782 [Penicillium capsulatum]
MHVQTPLSALGLLSLAVGAQCQSRRRCTYGDDCWPSVDTWNQFNATVGGRLIRSVPSAAVCHTQRYNAKQCALAKSSWLDSFWRTNQTGAYAAILWEMGETGQCFVDTAVDALCDQGNVPYYSVRAQSVEDIQASVRFASEKDLYLVTKNTGHDHLGRSSGKGAFSIWTHNLKGIKWHNSFVPRGAPADVGGVPAATIQAGEQWFDVYQAAAKQGRLIVGGSARTVVTSVTYKTHPVPQNLIMGFVQLNASNNASLTRVLAESFKLLPKVTDAGYTGYGNLEQGFGGFFIKSNSTVQAFNQTFAGFFNLTQLPGIHGAVAAFPSTWNGYREKFLQDPHISSNVQDISRLLTRDVINRKAEELARFIVKNGAGGGFNFIGRINNDERNNTAVNDIWKHSHALLGISVDWANNATQSEKHKKRLHAVQISEALAKIVGSEGGTYTNEANPYEPDWEKVFWGDKYERLVSIKRKVDPTHLFVCNRCVGGDLVLRP